MLAALALLAVQTAPVPDAAATDDIVVIGRRMDRLSAIVGRDAAGRFTCVLDGTSGNERLDGSLCKAASDCVRKGAKAQAAVSACVNRRKPALLADLAHMLADRR